MEGYKASQAENRNESASACSRVPPVRWFGWPAGIDNDKSSPFPGRQTWLTMKGTEGQVNKTYKCVAEQRALNDNGDPAISLFIASGRRNWKYRIKTLSHINLYKIEIPKNAVNHHDIKVRFSSVRLFCFFVLSISNYASGRDTSH